MADARPNLRRVCVVTGSRAEYGILRPLLAALDRCERTELQLVVTGSHLADRFGCTIGEIEEDGLPIARTVPILDGDTSRLGVAHAVGRAIPALATAFSELAPDLVLVLGDRYEVLAATQAAFFLGIPIAHLHGGEVTEGAWDESIRHAITKLAHLHLVAAREYARRVVQLGESSSHVHVVGALAVDSVRRQDLPTRAELDAALGLPITAPCLLVTFHPVTLRQDDEHSAVEALLRALDTVAEARIVITGANADSGNESIMFAVKAYAKARPRLVSLHTSLGQRNYLGLMRHAAAVVGNSSSGMIEAPAMGVPTVNIGERQRGRLRADSVIDCAEEAGAIASALAKALSPDFQNAAHRQILPYEGGGVAERILDILLNTDLGSLRIKPFRDL